MDYLDLCWRASKNATSISGSSPTVAQKLPVGRCQFVQCRGKCTLPTAGFSNNTNLACSPISKLPAVH
jgi:hypothetical protein